VYFKCFGGLHNSGAGLFFLSRQSKNHPLQHHSGPQHLHHFAPQTVTTSSEIKKILKTEKQYTPKPYNTIRNTTTEKTKIFKKRKKSVPDTPENGTDTTHSSVRLQNLHTDNPGDTFALQSGGTRTPEVC